MTELAEVSSVWDWQRFEAALRGMHGHVDVLRDVVAGIHEARDAWRDDQQEEKQRWTDIDEMAHRETELDWASDGYLDGDYTRDVDA
ncbi:hypothetical protein ACIA59_28945 [Micromonospora haikouensis]|uniref:hypothetical protein n=1 Tax=Micromonospora haikouensis TaxID=686309 RepID=UPI00379B155E